MVGEGDFVMIGGFIIEGTSSKTVLVTGRGPSLSEFGVPDALADPTLNLFDADGEIAFNNNWRDADNAAEIAVSPNRPSNNVEAAILVALEPGSYTAHLAGAGATTGQGLIEVWDEGLGETARLANISTRGQVGTDDFVMIGGFVIDGADPRNVLVTGLGPSLIEFGVPDALLDPSLRLFDADGQEIAFNDDWREANNADDISASPHGPNKMAEAAIFLKLDPGAYTVHLAGADDTTGQGLVEVWDETEMARQPVPFIVEELERERVREIRR
jgi:hypothetical protein